MNIIKEGTFDADVRNMVNYNLQQAMGAVVGSIYYLDALAGSDVNSGETPSKAVKTLAAGYALLRNAKNDVLVIMSGWTSATSTGFVFLNAGFTWAKHATHMMGACAPTRMGQRASIRPLIGATAFTPLLTVSGTGNYFANLGIVQEFTTGTTSQICTLVSGTRNVFDNCQLAGMVDTTSAASTGSRSLKITGGENYFRNCALGVDTIGRGVANATIEFASGCARNVFQDCLVPFYSTAGDCLGVITSAAASADRFQLFERCLFINATKSAGTTMTALCTLAASMGGMLVFKNSTLVGISAFGSDATSRGQIFIDGPGPVANATISQTGLAVAPNA